MYIVPFTSDLRMPDRDTEREKADPSEGDGEEKGLEVVMKFPRLVATTS